MLIFASISTKAEQPDSLLKPSTKDPVPSFMIPVDRDSIAGEMKSSQSGIDIYPNLPYSHQTFSNYSPAFNPAITGIKSFNINSPLFSFSSGSINAIGSQSSLPGFMGIDRGQINIQFARGPLTLTSWIGADKYGYFRGLQTAWNFGGRINITLSDKWSLTAWGEYVTPLHPLTPAMAGYMNSSNFGGYASYNFSDRWGVNVGAQATKSLVTNKWQAQPIVEPYYRINKRVSIGVDVGGILYNIAKDYIDSKNIKNQSFPNVGHPSRPPIPTPAKVAPRR